MLCQAVAQSPVTHLVMILRKNNELIIGTSIRLPTKHPLAICRINAVIDIGTPECFFQLPDLPKIGIVSISLPRHQRPQRMMKLVDPLPIQPKAAFGPRMDISRIG